jgi:hypothetical protein
MERTELTPSFSLRLSRLPKVVEGKKKARPPVQLGSLIRDPLTFVLVKTLAPKAKHSVRSCPIILPGDGRSQFHQLRRGEPLLEPLAQFWSHLRRRCRDRVRQFQHKFFIRREEVAFRVPVQVADLIVAQACASATGRVNVDSKRTFHQLGRTNLS